MLDFPIVNTEGFLISNRGEEVYIKMHDEEQFLGLLKHRVDSRVLFIRPNLKDIHHLFRKDQSYALDKKLVEKLAAVNAVLFFETDSGNYYTTADYMLEKGDVRKFGKYNTQVFLPRTLFKKAMP